MSIQRYLCIYSMHFLVLFICFFEIGCTSKKLHIRKRQREEITDKAKCQKLRKAVRTAPKQVSMTNDYASKTLSESYGPVEFCDRPYQSLKRTIYRNRKDIFNCYREKIGVRCSAQMKLTVFFTIAKTGQVKRIDVHKRTFYKKQFESCILRKILKWKFSKCPNEREDYITLPFVF